MSQTIEIALPDEVFLGLRKSPQELASDLRLAAAVKWYETGIDETKHLKLKKFSALSIFEIKLN